MKALSFKFYLFTAILIMLFSGCEPEDEVVKKTEFSSFNLDILMACDTKVTMKPSLVFSIPGNVSNDSHLSSGSGPKKFTKISGNEYQYEYTNKHTYDGMDPADFDNTKYVVKIFIDNNYANLEYYEKRERKAGTRTDEHIIELKQSQLPYKEKKGDKFIYYLTDIPANKVDYFFAQNKTNQEDRVGTHELVDKSKITGITNSIYLTFYE